MTKNTNNNYDKKQEQNTNNNYDKKQEQNTNNNYDYKTITTTILRPHHKTAKFLFSTFNKILFFIKIQFL